MIRSTLRQVRLDFENHDDLGADRAGQMRNHLFGNVDQIGLLARQFRQFDLHPGDPKQTWRMLGIEFHQSIDLAVRPGGPLQAGAEQRQTMNVMLSNGAESGE